MNKWPHKIYKIDFSFGGLHGKIWYDRWRENIWFESSGKLYVPIQVDKLIDALSQHQRLRLIFKLSYDEPMEDLIYGTNPFLKRIPKYDLYSAPIILGIDHGVISNE